MSHISLKYITNGIVSSAKLELSHLGRYGKNKIGRQADPGGTT